MGQASESHTKWADSCKALNVARIEIESLKANLAAAQADLERVCMSCIDGTWNYRGLSIYGINQRSTAPEGSQTTLDDSRSLRAKLTSTWGNLEHEVHWEKHALYVNKRGSEAFILQMDQARVQINSYGSSNDELQNRLADTQPLHDSALLKLKTKVSIDLICLQWLVAENGSNMQATCVYSCTHR